MVTRRCIFAEQLADDVLALDPPINQEGKYDERAKQVIKDDDDLIELHIPHSC